MNHHRLHVSTNHICMTFSGALLKDEHNNYSSSKVDPKDAYTCYGRTSYLGSGSMDDSSSDLTVTSLVSQKLSHP